MSGSAWLAIASCVSVILGLIFTLIGFASPYWIHYETGTSGQNGYEYRHQGLWQACAEVYPNDKDCDETVDSDNPDWFEACQALSTLGFIGTLLGTILLICWTCTYRLSMCMKITIILILLVSFVFLAVTVIVYRAEIFDETAIAPLNYNLDWSFYLMVVGCVFVGLSIIFIVAAAPSRYGQQKYPDGFPFGLGLGLQNLFSGPREYGSPAYGRVSRPLYGGTYGKYGGRLNSGYADYTGFYDREPHRRGGLGAYDPYSTRGRW